MREGKGETRPGVGVGWGAEWKPSQGGEGEDCLGVCQVAQSSDVLTRGP